MTTNFPGSIQELNSTRWADTDTMWSDGKSHILHHQIEDDTMEAMQTKLWIDNSSNQSSIDFLIRWKTSVSTNSRTFKAWINKSLDKATWDISKTTEWRIEHEKYWHYLYVQNGNISAKFDSTIKKTWRFSLKLSTISTAWQWIIASRQPTTDAEFKYWIPVNPSTKYIFGCWVKTFNAASNWVFLTISCRNADSSAQTLTQDSARLSGTNDWTFLFISFTTTANCSRLTYDLKNIVAWNISDSWFDINSMVLQEIVENSADTLIAPTQSLVNLKWASTTDGADQTQLTTSTGRGLGRSSQQKIAQQFLPKKSFLAGITLRKNDNVWTFTWDITVSIQTDSSNTPSGIKIATYKITNSVWNSYNKSLTYYIDMPCLLTADGLTTYWIVFESSTVDENNYAIIRANTASYTDWLYKEYNWSSRTTQSIDLYFRTNYIKRTTWFSIAQHNQNLNIKTNEDGVLNGATIDLQNKEYNFEIKPTTEITANQYTNMLYSASSGWRTDLPLKINAWHWQTSNWWEFATETGSIERQAVIKINTLLPISHLKITSKFGFTSCTSYLKISLDWTSWTIIDTHSDFQETLCETDFANGETTFYLQFFKDSTVNSYFYISNLKIQASIDTSSVPVLYNYPTNQDLYGTIIKSLSSAAVKVYIRLTKYWFPAFEYVDVNWNVIDYEYLPIDITGATNASETTYIKFVENGYSSNNKYGDGEYILLQTTTTLPVINFTIKIAKNRILLGSNNTNGISTKDGSSCAAISYMDKIQWLKYDVQDINTQINLMKSEVFGIKEKNSIVNTWEILKLGNYSLWIDSNGTFRVMLWNPTSDTAGTVVGAQS